MRRPIREGAGFGQPVIDFNSISVIPAESLDRSAAENPLEILRLSLRMNGNSLNYQR